uniref:Uncharacterized protein n=1 Tax=viral metagenome TaxID=1070528 RepID=A0A6M3L0S4_9ZZZZ
MDCDGEEKDRQMNYIKEGFWYGKKEPNLPFPKTSDDKKWMNKKIKFIRKLERIEDIIESSINIGKISSYKGFSKCRICKQKVGSREFEFKNWIWPEGFLHYIEKHNIKPTDDFIKFINHHSKIIDLLES